MVRRSKYVGPYSCCIANFGFIVSFWMPLSDMFVPYFFKKEGSVTQQVRNYVSWMYVAVALPHHPVRRAAALKNEAKSALMVNKDKQETPTPHAPSATGQESWMDHWAPIARA